MSDPVERLADLAERRYGHHTISALSGTRSCVDPCPWERNEPTDPAGAPPVPVGPGEEIRAARRAKPNRALWRDLDGLLLHRPPEVKVEETTVEPPKVFATAVELTDQPRVRALGFDQNKAKNTQFVSGLTSATVGHLSDQRADAQVAVGRLRRLGERYGENRLCADSPGAHARLRRGVGKDVDQDYFRALHRDEWKKKDRTDAAQAVPDPGSSAIRPPSPHTTPEGVPRADRAPARLLRGCTRSSERPRRSGKGGGARKVRHHRVRFEGTTEIVDPDALRAAVIGGIGKGWAYGCGLLTIAPLRPTE